MALKIGYTADADNLNPFVGYNAVAYEVWHLNYDMLVGYNTKDYSPAPEYAESWSISADGKTWTFKIRHGMKWQDGVPATAGDAAFTYNYIIENDMTAFSSFTKHIVKAVAVDDYTLQLAVRLAQGEHAPALDTDPAGAHLEERRPQEGRHHLPEHAARSSARGPSRRSSGRRAAT